MIKVKVFYMCILAFVLVLLVGCGADESSNSNSEKDQLVVVSWGGSGTDAQRESWYTPFTEETGIEIIEVTPPSVAQLKAQVDSGNVEWDVVLMDKAMIGSIQSQGDYLEEIPYEKFDDEVLGELTESAKNSVGVGAYSWGWALAYRTDVFDEAPQGWADFWDTEKFPGPRTMYDQPQANLEAAMFALGKDKANIYPIDIEAGKEKIIEIKPSIKSFWSAGAEGAQLLAEKEAVMGLVYTSQAASIKEQGSPVEIVWDQGIYSMDYWVIPKGRMSDAAVKFMEFISKAEQQAALASALPYGPTNEKAFDLIDDDRQKELITYPNNMERMVEYDKADWWAPVRQELIEKWNEWKLE